MASGGVIWHQVVSYCVIWYQVIYTVSDSVGWWDDVRWCQVVWGGVRWCHIVLGGTAITHNSLLNCGRNEYHVCHFCTFRQHKCWKPAFAYYQE